MSVLVTGDLHFSDRTRDEYRHVFARQHLPALLTKHRVDTLIVLGDLTEAKDNHSAILVNRVVDHFHLWSTSVSKLYILQGNHDGLTAEHPFFEFMQHLPNIEWIDRPTYESLPIGRCLFLPHTRDPDVDWKGLSFKDKDAAWIFCHNTFQGAYGDSGHVLGGISPDYFGRKSHVISGDVHTPQMVGPVMYAGAPYPIDFGDDYEPRVLMLTGDKVQSIPCPAPAGRKRTVVVSSIKDIAKAFKNASKTDLLRVDIDKASPDPVVRNELKRKIKEWADSEGYRVNSIRLVKVEPTVMAGQKAALTDRQWVERYAANRRLSESLKRTALEIMG